jgi:exodeoxyribonuclease VII large subunit
MNLEDKIIYTVSRIINEIKTVLEDSYPAVWITGEVSGFKTYSSGHSYFNLKDENSQIQAVLFAGFGKNINFVPQDGMQVVVYGKITSYVQRGTYQIQVFTIEQSGKGTLQESFEKLKNKLQREGFFDESRKKTLPFFIKKIAVVTSKDGAALHDILKVINQIKSSLDILIYPVKVQGEQAKFEIAEAIEYLNKNHGDIDVMLVGRGGGSLEDLWAFNEEIVARAIYNSKIPVISCVGHEIDYTIADFTADVRAATPSVAAEIIVKNRKKLKTKLICCLNAMSGGIKNILFVCGEK